MQVGAVLSLLELLGEQPLAGERCSTSPASGALAIWLTVGGSCLGQRVR